MSESPHARRVILAWLVLSVVVTPIVVLVLGPHLPPGSDSNVANEQVDVNTILVASLTPIIVLFVVFFAYVLVVFHERGDGSQDGPPIHGHQQLQTLWIVLTSVFVLAFAAYGSVKLLQTGAGGGQGPSPVAEPSGAKLPVQVIGQQWEFTYRYPTYGGVETPHLVLPVGRQIELHVTSIDATHSFWAYGLGVKADANPGVDNVAYVKPVKLGSFEIRCAELCGLWHGYMYNAGRVVSPQQFHAWITSQQKVYEPIAKYLPAFRKTYLPDPQRRGG